MAIREYKPSDKELIKFEKNDFGTNIEYYVWSDTFHSMVRVGNLELQSNYPAKYQEIKNMLSGLLEVKNELT